MCFLSGMTHCEAADLLGCAEGTVSSLISRGLAKLRAKVAGRDPAELLALALVPVPVSLASAAVRSAAAVRLASLASTASPSVAALTQGVLRMFWIKKATTIGLATAMLVAVGICVGLSMQTGPVANGQERTELKKTDSTARVSSTPKPAEPIPENGVIVGRLVDAATGKPVKGATIACGAVYTDSGRAGGSNHITDADGRYRLSVPSPGIYNVWLKEFGKEPTKTAAADDGVLVEAGKVSASALKLQEGRKIKGKVVNSDGSASANIEVCCYSAARPHSGGIETMETKADGTFEFFLPPGRAYLYVIKFVKLSVQYEGIAPTDMDPILSKLATGKVELEVKDAEPQAKAPVNQPADEKPRDAEENRNGQKKSSEGKLTPKEAEALLPEAASLRNADFEALVEKRELPKVNHSPTYFVLTFQPPKELPKDAEKDFEWTTQASKFDAVAKALTVSNRMGFASIIQDRYITECTCEVRFFRSDDHNWKQEMIDPEKQSGEKPSGEKPDQAFTAWGKEIGGLQAGLGFHPGEKRVYSHGETVMSLGTDQWCGACAIICLARPTRRMRSRPPSLPCSALRFAMGRHWPRGYTG